MNINKTEACQLLRQGDRITILAHAKPDGDTLGSSFALYYALRKMGKQARVESPDGYPDRYRFLYGDYAPEDFEPELVVAVDVAGSKLLGSLQQVYGQRVDLCIDHHKSNENYAWATLLDPAASATAEIVYEVITELGVKVDATIANAVFTGLTTDTGCFRYSSVTAETHRVAAAVIEQGADHSRINKLMFQTKSRGRIAVDRMIMEHLQFHLDDRCAFIQIPADVKERFGVSEEELDGIAAFPTTIEGVLAGVTLRDQGNGNFRVSMRSAGAVDASGICANFGGGGHRNAAGCTMTGEAGQVRQQLLQAVEKELDRTHHG